MVGVAVRNFVTHVAEGGDGKRADFSILFAFPLDMVFIFQRSDCSDRSQHIDIAHTPGTVDGIDSLLLADECATDSQTSYAMSLGERPADEYVFKLKRQPQRGFHCSLVGIVDIGFVPGRRRVNELGLVVGRVESGFLQLLDHNLSAGWKPLVAQ